MHLEMGHNKTSDDVLEMLKGLPFRQEVPGGKDLRGADFAGGADMDFSGWDFSLGFVGPFHRCNLSHARFEGATADNAGFHNILNFANFRGVKFRRCYFMNSQAQHCCFDKARLFEAAFQDADLSGSKFVEADCHGASFFGANLKGCDFRGCNLEGAVLQNISIDEKTDIRGACLVNAFYKDQYDTSGKLFGRGTDFRIAKLDATTKFGTDEAAMWKGLLDAALVVLKKDAPPESRRIMELLTDAKKRLGKESWEDLLNEIYSKLTEEEGDVFDGIMEDAYRELE